MTSDTNIDTRLRNLEVEFLHGVPVRLPESAVDQIKQLITEEKKDMLESKLFLTFDSKCRSCYNNDYIIKKHTVELERLAALQGQE